MRPKLFRPYRFSPTAARRMVCWRIILPVWIPRYERFYDICSDLFRYGVRVDSIALSFARDRHGLKIGLDWGPVEVGQWTPEVSTKPVPRLAA